MIFSSEELSRIQAMWDKGVPVKLMARELGREPEWLARALHNHVRRKKVLTLPRRRLHAAVVAPSGARYATQREAARAAGVSQKKIWRRLQDPASGWRRDLR